MKYFAVLSLCALLSACGSSDSSNDVGTGDDGDGGSEPTVFTVTASASSGGEISPATQAVNDGEVTTFTLTPDAGFTIDDVSGCGGSLSESTYTTAAITADCTVTSSFANVIAVTGNRVVYIAYDQSTSDSDGLYIVDTDGENPSRLNPDLVSGGNVTDFTWSNDGARIIYLADQETDGRMELYSVSADGSGLTKLNTTLLDAAGVSRFSLSPEGNTIAYLARQDTNDTTELYTVVMDGTNNTKVNDTLVAGGNVSDFVWSPDGQKILYLSDLEVNERFELYAANIDGSDHRNVNVDMGANQGIYGYKWSPNSAYISYALEDDPGSSLPGATNKTQYAFNLVANSNAILLANENIINADWREDSETIVIVDGRSIVGRRLALGYGSIWANTPDGANLIDLTQNIKLTDDIAPEQYGFIPNSESVAILSRDFGAADTVDLHIVSLADGVLLDSELTNGDGGRFINYNYFNDGLILTSEQRVRYYESLQYIPFTFSPDGRYIVINDTALSVYDTQSETLLEITTHLSYMRSIWLSDTDSILYFEMENSFEPITFERFFINPVIVNPLGSVIADIDQIFGGDDSTTRAVNPMLLGDNKIAFERFPSAQRPLVVIDTDGQNLTVLSTDSAIEIVDYQLASDGATVVYTRGCNLIVPCVESGLYSVGLDGSSRSQISPPIFTTTGVRGFAVQP